ncbi:pilus assembly protein TadG-related protein [Streptomyces sp. NPDC012623]|uniref:pilus assembly protein TadG-related protein n=1 Tax=unclassified Streptomyces TaxID=2593676 RepID=UPI00368CAC35
MIARRTSESGQAAPIYITMVAGLLFLALAFFAVGQAGATRGSAQSAADAAALAAAQESRDLFREDLLTNLLKPGFLDDVFNGNPIGTADGCAAAARFADENKADLDNTADGRGCGRSNAYHWGFSVNVITQKPMGSSILPGTETKYAKAQATAVVQPRCTFKAAEEEEGEEEPPGNGDDPENEDDSDSGGQPSPGTLVCGGTYVPIDPEHLDLLPDIADLFSVRLAKD